MALRFFASFAITLFSFVVKCNTVTPPPHASDGQAQRCSKVITKFAVANTKDF
jgi:hypothetical protein